MGNPHCVIFVPSTQEAPVVEIGKALQKHPAFPRGVNVSFMQVLARNHVKCRVYERGVGETLACGSGACASVVAGILQEELNPEVKVDMEGGALTVCWAPDSKVILSGPAIRVFHGSFCMLSQELT
jgi:diaminopimelate epimerase